ncbi:MAG: WD40 repeat domain-containing protein [Chloroflexi bacterium]|nr:WD40 repeat domain-containing protein [Chloroflexota bacterium]
MRQICRRILLVVFVLFGLANRPAHYLAQEQYPWGTVLIAMSNSGRHLAAKYDTGEKDGDEFSSEVWIYNLDDFSSTPRHLADTDQFYSQLSFSPDSHQIAIAEKGRLRVFSTEDHSQILDFPYAWQEDVVHHRLSFSPDSRHLMYYRNVPHYSKVSGADEGRIMIWDIETGLRDHETPYRSQDIADDPRLSPDWRYLLDRSHSDGLRIYEFDRANGLGSRIATFPTAARDTAFSGDDSLFAFVAREDEIHVYRTDTWELAYVQLLSEYTCHGKYAMLTFHHLNPWMACLGNERLSVWDIETGVLLLSDEIDVFFSLISWDSGMLLVDNRRYTGPGGKEIILWDANNAFAKSTFPGWNPRLHPNGELMAAINPDQRVTVWNIRSKEQLAVLPMPQQ